MGDGREGTDSDGGLIPSKICLHRFHLWKKVVVPVLYRSRLIALVSERHVKTDSDS